MSTIKSQVPYSQASNFGPSPTTHHPSLLLLLDVLTSFFGSPVLTCVCSRNSTWRLPSRIKSNVPNMFLLGSSSWYMKQFLSKTNSQHTISWTGFRYIAPIKVTSPTTFDNCQSSPAASTDFNVVHNIMTNILKILANLQSWQFRLFRVITLIEAI